MAYSIYNDIGDGITKIYDFTFPYIEKKDVKVFVDDIELVQGVNLPGQENDFYIDGTLTYITVAPILDSNIKIQRITPISELNVKFTNTSIEDADDLNVSNLQQLYKLQEISDVIQENINSFAGNNTMNQNLNMNNFKVINLGEAVNDDDALSYGQAIQIANDTSAPVIEYIVNGIGYEVAQTALSGVDLTLETDGGIEFVSRELTTQYLISEYPEFDLATNGAYGVGGGLFELPFIDSPDTFQGYYTRLK